MSGFDQLDTAGILAEQMRQTSDLLTGAVNTLIAEGWTEHQARRIVVAIFVKAMQ